MVENIIIAILVAGSLLFVLRYAFSFLKGNGGCSEGCGGTGDCGRRLKEFAARNKRA